jgi:thioredoxin:protein disulfide reductase
MDLVRNQAVKKLLHFLLAVLVSAPAFGQLNVGGSAEDLLEPEKAFRFSARAPDDRSIEVRYVIADGYYMYRDRFRFALRDSPGVHLGTPEMPKGARHKDEFFGEVETYRDDVRIRIPLEGAVPGGSLRLTVTSQGCADIGVCYVPMESTARIAVASDAAVPGLSQGARSVDSTTRFSLSASDMDIARLFEGSFPLVLASFFGFGILLAFTPCMLPMVPILSSIIAGEGRALNKARALTLSATYVLGMAIAYAAAGVAAALSGSLLAAALQNPWVLGSFALVFVVLALSMFGLYELRLPHFVYRRLDSAHRGLQGGRIASVAAMGVLSAVIVSPCVAAPLAGALLYISQTRDIVLGGTALFAMALGMGIPLIAVGVSEGALIPKAGPWMLAVRRFFGVLLLGVAIWIASPVLPAALTMAAWAALFVGSAIFLGALDRMSAQATAWTRLGKGLGIIALVYGVALLVGVLGGSRDPLRPLAGVFGNQAVHAPVPWSRIASTGELDERLRAPGRPVMLDFYADWCVSCKEMESFTFSDPRVRARMESMLLLQADVTANSESHRALLKRFSLFGPPGIIFFDEQGREIKGLRVIGFQNAERFLKTLERMESPI